MARKTRKTPGAWGTVEHLPSGRFRAFYRKDGTRFTAPRTFETKAHAQAWLATERADRSRGTWRDPALADVLLGDYAAEWLEARPDLAPRTIDVYKRALDRWVLSAVPVARSRSLDLGAMRLSEISPSVVRTWFAGVFSSSRDAAERRRARTATRVAHPAREWAIARGYRIAETGRLSPDLLSAWRDAGSPSTLIEAPAIAGGPEGAGRTAAAHAYRVLRAVMSTAVADGLIPANPCQIPNAGTVHHRERATASPEEVERLAEHMPPPLTVAVLVAAWSGLRYGEQFALARRHVDLDKGTLTVERALVCVPGQPIRFGRPKTIRSARVVHLPAFVTKALRQHLDQHVAPSPDALVFSSQGAPVTNARLSFLFRRAVAAIGRTGLTWHDLRHTGALLAYRAGASVAEVQGRLGHSTLRAASIYMHLATDADQALAARIDEMFGTPR